MSIANVVLLGFTTGSGGHKLPTLGFGIGESSAPSPGVVVRGASESGRVRGRSSARIRGRSSSATIRSRSRG